MCVWLRRPHPGPQAKAPFCSDLEPRVLGSYAMCHLWHSQESFKILEESTYLDRWWKRSCHPDWSSCTSCSYANHQPWPTWHQHGKSNSNSHWSPCSSRLWPGVRYSDTSDPWTLAGLTDCACCAECGDRAAVWNVVRRRSQEIHTRVRKPCWRSQKSQET